MVNTTKMPDLMNGSMTMGLNIDNAWKTYIEAALFSDKEKAFLSTNCRVEHIRESGDLIGRRFAEFSVISTSNKDWIIRSGAGIWHPFHRKICERIHYQETLIGTEVFCKDVDVIIMTFEKLYEYLTDRKNDNHLYMKIAYVYNEEYFEIICPCRYTNYANSTLHKENGKKYIQPISGYVLFKHDNKYYHAYVVAYVDDSGTRNCEVVLRVPSYLIDLKRKVGGVSISILSKIFRPFKRLLITDEFSHVIKLDAEVSFFVIAHPGAATLS